MVKLHKSDQAGVGRRVAAYRAATAALPEGVAILNEVNRIEWCNPLAEQHFGLIAERDIMQDITYLVRQRSSSITCSWPISASRW